MDILKNAVIIFAADIPWLYAVSGWTGTIIRGIQGSPLELNWLAAIPVYLALGYLLTFATSALKAFTMGAAVYAVYDFTNLATFKKYPLEFAVADSLWGGIVMTIAWYLQQWLQQRF